MKIHQSEIDAAMNVFLNGYAAHAPSKNTVETSLEAAYRVRKARKAAKREKARENGKRLVKGVQELRDAVINGGEGLTLHTPKPLTIEAGKSYRTRDGRKVKIFELGMKVTPGYFEDRTMSVWYKDGRNYNDDSRHFDLIAEWQE